MRDYTRLTQNASNELGAYERIRKSQPRPALRHLRRALLYIRKADILRGHTVLGLAGAGGAECATPDEKYRAESAVIDVLWEWMRNGPRVDTVMQQVQQALAQVFLSGAEREERPPVLPALHSMQRRLLRHSSQSARDRILAFWKRRQRSKAAAPEDAPRKLSRGRAPPLVSICFP